MLALSPAEMCLERSQNCDHTNCRLLSSHWSLSSFVSGPAFHLEHLPGPNLFIGVAVTWTTEFYVLSLWSFCWWAVSSVRSDVYPQPTVWTIFKQVCDYLPLTPGHESLWNGAGLYWDHLQNDRCLLYLDSCVVGWVEWDSPQGNAKVGHSECYQARCGVFLCWF